MILVKVDVAPVAPTRNGLRETPKDVGDANRRRQGDTCELENEEQGSSLEVEDSTIALMPVLAGILRGARGVELGAVAGDPGCMPRGCQCRDRDALRCSERAYFSWAIHSDNYDPRPCSCRCHADPDAWPEEKPPLEKPTKRAKKTSTPSKG